MTTLQEAAQAVLDRWDSPAWRWDKHGPTADLMADLRAALAAPEQEPVAWMDPASGEVISVARYEVWKRDYGLGGKDKSALFTMPLYTAPPQRRPLTEKEIGIATGKYDARHSVRIAVARAIEAAHGIKEEK